MSKALEDIRNRAIGQTLGKRFQPKESCNLPRTRNATEDILIEMVDNIRWLEDAGQNGRGRKRTRSRKRSQRRAKVLVYSREEV